MARVPIWLWIAAATLMGHGVEALIRHPFEVVWITSLAFAMLLGWLLLRASRVAWILTLVASVSQLITPFATDGSLWVFGLATIRLACLLTPSSRDFVWSERKPTVLPSREPGTLSRWRSVSRLAGPPALLTSELSALTVTARDLARQRGLDNKLLVRLAIGVVALMLALTPLYEVQQGFGRGSVVLDVVWIVVWVSFNIALLTFVALMAIRAYRYLKASRQEVLDN